MSLLKIVVLRLWYYYQTLFCDSNQNMPFVKKKCVVWTRAFTRIRSSISFCFSNYPLSYYIAVYSLYNPLTHLRIGIYQSLDTLRKI